MMHGEMMSQGGHMMSMGMGMMGMLVVYAIVVVVFLWLMYRGVVALEKIANRKSETSQVNE